MYHALLQSGTVECENYERGDHGVDLYDDEGEFVAFVPYENLLAVVDEAAERDESRSIL